MLLKTAATITGGIGLWAGCVVTHDANGAAIAISGATIILVTCVHGATHKIIAAVQPRCHAAEDGPTGQGLGTDGDRAR